VPPTNGDGDIGGFPTTWRVLRQLLAPIQPAEVFLTNAFIGLRDLASDTAPFPTTPSFVRWCEDLLSLEIELFRPRLVVCLGVPAAKLLAAITPAAAAWRPWPGYVELDRRADRVSMGCAVAGSTSLRWLSITRQPWCRQSSASAMPTSSLSQPGDPILRDPLPAFGGDLVVARRS